MRGAVFSEVEVDASECAPFRALQAVVFDWAGTTVDFGCQAPVRAIIDAFREFGVSVTMDEVREPMGMGKRDHIIALLAMPRIAEQWRVVHGVLPEIPDIEMIYDRVKSIMNTIISVYSDPINGVIDAVQTMRNLSLRIGSCTGYPREIAEKVAACARKYGYIPDVMVCASDVPQGRPAPDMCCEVLRMLNVTDPSRAVKVGDTVQDVFEGRRAGMWVIGVTISGSLSGMTYAQVKKMSETQRLLLHTRLSDELIEAGAHFTVPEVAASLPILRNIDDNRRERFKP